VNANIASRVTRKAALRHNAGAAFSQEPTKSNMKKTFLATLALAAISAPAMAQDTPWYAHVQAGQSKYDLDGLPGDNKDRFAILGLGYKLSPQLAVEGGYADFGKIKFSGASGEAKSIYAAAILSAPVTDAFSVYGRLGVANTDRKASFLGFSDNDRKTEGIYGAGLSYAFSKNVAGTLEYTKLSDSDVAGYALGVKFSF
jgi:OOP family OmpA-OmpF porin